MVNIEKVARQSKIHSYRRSFNAFATNLLPHEADLLKGSPVENANFYNLAKGTARGGAPSARIAMYKVCWNDNYYDIDVLATFDDAIHDGVDIISLSLGGSPQLYFQDAIAIGSFHTDRKGIVMTCSAGNEGPAAMSVSNLTPWILTVAANDMDRSFQTDFWLENGTRIH
ncbi:hypothetical protein GIB67_038366, partial [Kingdonia uniflora]